jgi:hypothetical protein
MSDTTYEALIYNKYIKDGELEDEPMAIESAALRNAHNYFGTKVEDSELRETWTKDLGLKIVFGWSVFVCLGIIIANLIGFALLVMLSPLLL